jgi:hypothetical protein
MIGVTNFVQKGNTARMLPRTKKAYCFGCPMSFSELTDAKLSKTCLSLLQGLCGYPLLLRNTSLNDGPRQLFFPLFCTLGSAILPSLSPRNTQRLASRVSLFSGLPARS